MRELPRALCSIYRGFGHRSWCFHYHPSSLSSILVLLRKYAASWDMKITVLQDVTDASRVQSQPHLATIVVHLLLLLAMYLEKFLSLGYFVLENVSMPLRSDPGCCPMFVVINTCVYLSSSSCLTEGCPLEWPTVPAHYCLYDVADIDCLCCWWSLTAHLPWYISLQCFQKIVGRFSIGGVTPANHWHSEHRSFTVAHAGL